MDRDFEKYCFRVPNLLVTAVLPALMVNLMGPSLKPFMFSKPGKGRSISQCIVAVFFLSISRNHLKDMENYPVGFGFAVHWRNEADISKVFRNCLIRPNFVDLSDGFDLVLGEAVFFGEALGSRMVDLGDDALGQGLAYCFDGC